MLPGAMFAVMNSLNAVEQQDVALQAQPARDREEHVLLDRGVVDQKGVHRPVRDLRISAQVGLAG